MYAKNAWEKYTGEARKDVMVFGEEYRVFISENKTEREQTRGAVALLKAKGFVPYVDGMKLAEGSKVYFINRGKNVAAFVVGKKKVSEGMRIVGAHIDSPRLDLKQVPFYENSGLAFADTHYYGGIKNYQYVARPFALHGVVIKKDGTPVEIVIGEDPKDPVIGINDILIHLSYDQMSKPASKVIEGENLDFTIGNIPLEGSEKHSVKDNILAIIKEKYDIEEEDFLSAEIEAVPAGEARDFGLDRSMVAGYGHDDKSCAYSSLRAVLDLEEVPEFTSCCILVDKEEIGSVGSTGAHSRFFENCVLDVMDGVGEDEKYLRRALANSYMLSSDVSAALDPLYAYAMERKNTCFLGNGVVFNKYLGSRGKSGSNDADAEYVAYIRNVMDSNNVNFQTAELGKVDQGGGGTIAYISANLGIHVMDAGIPVLNMHSPMEVVSKVDVYEAYKAYSAFLLSK